MSVANNVRSPEETSRIAVFLPSLEGGGAERVFATLANGFAQRGYAVDLVLTRASGPYLATLNGKVNVIDLGATSVSTSLRPLTRYLATVRPSAVLSALSHANVIALLAHKLARSDARIVVSERLSFDAARRFHRGIKDRLIRLGMRFTYKWADQVTVVSERMIDELTMHLRLDAQKVRLIYNPVLTESLIVAAQEEPAHPWLKGGDTPVVLGCGRLSRQKDFSTLIEAFARVRERCPARLVILGEGEDRAALTRQVESLGLTDDVDLPGFVSNPFPLMRTASVFVLSSLYEGMPGALIQALACGAAVVSTDCPTGPAEILDHGRWGLLVPPGDADSMSRAIHQVLNQNVNLDGRERAQAFTENQSVSNYLQSLGVECARSAIE